MRGNYIVREEQQDYKLLQDNFIFTRHGVLPRYGFEVYTRLKKEIAVWSSPSRRMNPDTGGPMPVPVNWKASNQYKYVMRLATTKMRGADMLPGRGMGAKAARLGKLPKADISPCIGEICHNPEKSD